MNKLIIKSVKVALTAGALAAALTGCCMFGKRDCCCKGPENCCCTEKCCKEKCHEPKTHGMNTSMTLGVGTDGIRVGSDSNAGNHKASMHMNADAGKHGMTADAGGGVK